VQNILGVTAYFLHGIILSTVAFCFSEGSLNTFHLLLLCIFEHKYLYSLFLNYYPSFFFVHQKCQFCLSAVTTSRTEIFGQVLGTAAWYSRGLGFRLYLWDQLSWWCFIVGFISLRQQPGCYPKWDFSHLTILSLYTTHYLIWVVQASVNEPSISTWTIERNS
jgi:hypothetical protein